MNYLDLAQHLKLLAPIYSVEGILSKPAGIPPCISIAVQLHYMIGIINLMIRNFSNKKDEIISCITSVIGKKAFDTGNIAGSMLKEILQEYKNNIEAKMPELNNAQKETFNESQNYTLNNQVLDDSNVNANSTGYAFACDRRF